VSTYLRSTRGRLTLLALAAVGTSLVLADAAVLGSLDVTQSSEADQALVAQATLLSGSIDQVNGQPSFGGGDVSGETSTGVAVDAVIVTDGQVVAQSSGQSIAPGALRAIAAQSLGQHRPVWGDVTDVRNVPRRLYAVPLQLDQARPSVLVVNRSVAELQSALRRTLLLVALLSVLTLGVTGLVANWLAGRVLRPVRTIAGLARGISEKDLHRRVEVRVPPDELGELVDTFNGMLDRLEADFESLRRFTADASHELRAPLALMRAELELSLSRTRHPSDYRSSQRTVLAEVEHLSRVADQLLLLARADAGTLKPVVEPIDVVDLMTETEHRWSAESARQSVVIHASKPAEGTVGADPSLLRRVLDNLIENAIRHAPPGSGVLLRAFQSGDAWVFEVADRGQGVPAELRPRLFDRFFSAEEARTRDGSGGAGLGLALCAAIARAHGGDLRLAEPAGGVGAVFQLWLPGAPDGAPPRSADVGALRGERL
jgi:two-component system OmpR family sensor kinase